MIRQKLQLFGLSVLAGVSLSSLPLFAQDGPPPGAPGGNGPGEPPSQQDSKALAEAQAAGLAKLDGVKGYGGLEFGSEFSKAKDQLVIEQDRGPLKLYKKKKENLLIGTALMETILYYYYEDKLLGIPFPTPHRQDSLALKSVFHTAFGPGEDSVDDGPSTIWIGKKVGALFDLNPSTGESSAFVFDHKIHDAYLNYENTANQKAADQLLKRE